MSVPAVAPETLAGLESLASALADVLDDLDAGAVSFAAARRAESAFSAALRAALASRVLASQVVESIFDGVPGRPSVASALASLA